MRSSLGVHRVDRVSVRHPVTPRDCAPRMRYLQTRAACLLTMHGEPVSMGWHRKMRRRRACRIQWRDERAGRGFDGGGECTAYCRYASVAKLPSLRSAQSIIELALLQVKVHPLRCPAHSLRHATRIYHPPSTSRAPSRPILISYRSVLRWPTQIIIVSSRSYYTSPTTHQSWYNPLHPHNSQLICFIRLLGSQ